MLGTFALVVPLGLAGAVSPVLLTEQTVLLAGPGGYRAGLRFAAGAGLVLLIIVCTLVLFGRAISLPTAPTLDATLDLVLGLALLVVAVVVRRLGRRNAGGAGADDEDPSSPHRTQAAFPFGAFSMATNFTTLALMAPAAKEISAAGVDIAERAVLVLVLVGLATIPAWLPVALVRVAPGPAQRILAALQTLIARHGRTAVVVLLGAAGVFFVARGLIRLLG